MNATPTSTSQRSGLLLALCGLLVGIGGTVFVMSRSRPVLPPVTQTAETSEEKPVENGPIRLSEAAAKTAGLRVITAQLAPLHEGLTVPGTVELSPNRSAKVTPPAAGKLVRLLVNPGDSVRAGQPLAVLDSYEIAQAHAAVRQAESSIQQARAGTQTAQAETAQARAGVQQAQGDVAQARIKQTSAEVALQRQRDLAQAGAFSQAPLQTAQAELASAQSELLKAQTELQSHTVVLQRAERLFREELISRSELEQAQLEHRQDEAQVQQAQTRVASVKQTVEREQRVFSGDLLTKQAVQTAEAEVRTAQGEVQRAKQSLYRAQQDVRRAQKGEEATRILLQGAESSLKAAHATLFALEGTEHTEGDGGLIRIISPINGVVTERAVTVGEAVERTTALMVIENLNTVTVNASVAEKEVARVRVGQSVQVSVPAYPGETFPGVVRNIAGRVDEKTRALAVRCLVENRAGRLKPEMFARVTLGVSTAARAISVPLSALEEDGAERFVYVETPEGYVRRKVEAGRKTLTSAEITEGLKPGEKVVVEGVFVLKSESKKDTLKEEE